MKRHLAGASLVLIAITTLAGPASAGPEDATCNQAGASDVAVIVGAACGSDSGPGGASPPSPPPPCTGAVLSAEDLASGIAAWEAADPATRPPTAISVLPCDGGAAGAGVYIGLTGTSIVDLTNIVVGAARSQLVIDLPDIVTSPPRGGLQLVGVPIWFWARDARPISTTATIPGLSATLTANPGTLRIDVTGAEDATVDCPDTGTAYRPGDDPWASSSCSHAFDTDGTATVTATLDWHLAWTATNGQAGELPDVTRTTTFTLRVEEARAVTD